MNYFYLIVKCCNIICEDECIYRPKLSYKMTSFKRREFLQISQEKFQVGYL